MSIRRGYRNVSAHICIKCFNADLLPGICVHTPLIKNPSNQFIFAFDFIFKYVLNLCFDDIFQDHHQYYNSTTYTDKDKADKYWNDIKNITPNWMLSQSHRRAMVMKKHRFP